LIDAALRLHEDWKPPDARGRPQGEPSGFESHARDASTSNMNTTARDIPGGPVQPADEQAFVYRDWHFSCSAQRQPDTGLYQPIVKLNMPGPDGKKTLLPEDVEPYATEAEALRHAEQQAMRWVNDRTGDGRGQF
jgi:hypothetical protein